MTTSRTRHHHSGECADCEKTEKEKPEGQDRNLLVPVPAASPALSGRQRPYLLPGSIVLAAILMSTAWVLTVRMQTENGTSKSAAKNAKPAGQNIASATQADTSKFESIVLPSSGVELPISWKGLGKKLLNEGVIDQTKLEALYAQRGGLGKNDQALLDGSDQKIVMTAGNASYLLNLLWAFGLANKSSILEQGPISDKQYGGAGGFASTGGWTLAKGEAMGHFSKHAFVKLTVEQQQRVENVSKNIFRPCCGNATNFPDCNHGMAMLGLLELMAEKNISEQEMYRVALQVNAYWFPDTYLTIASYLQSKGTSWQRADPKELLGKDYSSSSGYRQIASQVTPTQGSGGSGCGV